MLGLPANGGLTPAVPLSWWAAQLSFCGVERRGKVRFAARDGRARRSEPANADFAAWRGFTGKAKAMEPPRSLPYGLHLIEDDDVAAVEAVLNIDVAKGLLDADDARAVLDAMRADLLAQGPLVAAFEAAFRRAVSSREAVACSSGTAGLHLALTALDVAAGDVCVVPAMTFLSTATAARMCGAEVVFADVDPVTGLMTPDTLAEALDRAGARAKAVLPVHLAGRACDMQQIGALAKRRGLRVVEDGCHAMGTVHAAGAVGDCAYSDATVFSLHPVKMIACGEGGMVTAGDPGVAERVRRLRNHGVTRDPQLMGDRALSFEADGRPNPWSYEQLELGFNYRLTELQAALGLSQLGKLGRFLDRRLDLAARYDRLLTPLAPLVRPVPRALDQRVSLHLYVVHLDFARLPVDRATLMRRLAARGIGVQVHYIPIYRQPYFEARYGPMRLDGAEAYYRGVLALPLFPAMTDEDVDRVFDELVSALI
jgi:UDP-4-amino-4,6-dideoxy-N-acetyl-beta-L-altrosamine transaminase